MTTWEEERAIQNEHLRQQLHALAKGDRSRWLRFRRLVVNCGQCQSVLLEVMETDPYWVLRFRETIDHPSVTLLSAQAPIDDHIAHMRTSPQAIRRDREWRFVPIPTPVPPDSPELATSAIYCVCNCRTVELSQRDIFDDLRQGQKQRTIPRSDTPDA